MAKSDVAQQFLLDGESHTTVLISAVQYTSINPMKGGLWIEGGLAESHTRGVVDKTLTSSSTLKCLLDGVCWCNEVHPIDVEGVVLPSPTPVAPFGLYNILQILR